MSAVNFNLDRITDCHAFRPSALSQERLQVFMAESERRRRSAVLGYYAGFGLIASLAIFVLGRVFT
jgi:hypothetical protein